MEIKIKKIDSKIQKNVIVKTGVKRTLVTDQKRVK